MPRQGSGKSRPDGSEVAFRTSHGGRSLLHPRAKGSAAFDDLVLLEELEDRLDAEEAVSALADAKVRGQRPIPWGTAKKKLGL